MQTYNLNEAFVKNGILSIRITNFSNNFIYNYCHWHITQTQVSVKKAPN